MSSKNHSVSVRLTAVCLTLVALIIAVSSTVNFFSLRAERKENQHLLAQEAMARMSESLPASIWNLDKNQIENILKSEMAPKAFLGMKVASDSSVLSSVGRDAAGKLVPNLDVSGASADFSGPLVYKDGAETKSLGTLTVYLTDADIREKTQSDLLRLTLQGSALLGGILLVLWFGLRQVVLRPLNAVIRAIENVAEGDADLTRRLPAFDTTEFDRISRAFNTFTGRIQSTMRQIQQSVVTVNVAAQEIAAGNADLSQRTEVQACNIGNTTSTVQAITETVKDTAAQATEITRLATATSEVASQGAEAIRQVSETMHSIETASKKIESIAGVMQGLSFQTNILALNAAVESARAGEHGRGFAVVAHEVRSLAQRAAKAADEVGALIADSSQKVAVGATKVSDAASTMDTLSANVVRVSSIMTGIASASASQASRIEGINQNMSEMDAMTQRNAALVEEAAAAAESLKTQSSQLASIVGEFRIEA